MQLELVFPDDIPSGHWMRLRYLTSLYCSASRFVIRFSTDGGETRAAMPAALFGTGDWVGLIPKGTRRVSIVLPAGYTVADFALVSCEVLSLRELITLVWKGRTGMDLLTASWGAFRRRGEMNGILEEMLGASSLERYHEWRTRNRRELDPAGLDAQRDSWREAPHIRVILHVVGEERAAALDETVASLHRQTYPNWSLVLLGKEMAYRGLRKPVRVEIDARAGLLWEGLEASDIVMPVVAGDVVADYAMAALAEFASGRADCSMFYADEDSIDIRGRYVAPELKPDWSPIFHHARPYVGRAVYFRRQAVEVHADVPSAAFLRPSALEALFAAESGPVGHVRRMLLTKPWKPAAPPVMVATPPSGQARATLIIPTRDRADLLAACLSGLEKTRPRDFDLVIVDNGSKEPATRDLLDRMRMHSWVRLLEMAGPFNFSALCNRAAENAQGRVLVFLNNDTVAMTPDWLAHLTSWTMRPDVGAVGAKLVYPSGRIQHAGLVLGLGGYAAHIDVGERSAHRGYLDRFTVPHEVSAVTGACLAVEKEKFDAIGGFDAERYPIELGDVDLCLRLRQRGWKTVFTPHAVLAHHESATRGRSNVAERYATERRHFLEGWKDAIFDDPCFHPALSLTVPRTSLDH